MTSEKSNKHKKAVTGECKLSLTVCVNLLINSLVECLACFGFVINDVAVCTTRGTSELWGHGRGLVPYRLIRYKGN